MRVYLLLVAIIAVLAVAVVSVQSPAVANDPGRTIPTITVSSPSAGKINAVWGTPSETGTLTSYRVSWALWTKNGFTSYKDANSDTGGNAYPTAPASSYTIRGLAPGEYAVYVRARYEDFQNGPFIKSSKVVVGSTAQDDEEPMPEPAEDPTPTPAPTEAPTPEPTPEPALAPGSITSLTLTSSGPGQLWVSWDEASPGPTEYRLNWAEVDDPFPSWNSRDGGNLWLSPRTAQDFSNIVEAGVTYKLWMRAIYKTGPNAPWSGPWSEVVTQRVWNHPPGAPTGLSVDSVTHDGVVLSWSAPGHSVLTGYRILRGSDADSLETIVEDTGNLATGYTDTTAADDATHHYAIIALSLDGDGRRSGTVSAATPARTPVTPVIQGAPGAPSTLTAQLDGSGGVTLSWTDPDDNAITGYRILRGDDALSMRVIKENTGSATVGYTDATAPVNSTHVYAVQAHNSVGLSQLSNTVSVTTLSAPTELETSAASGRVALSWSAPDLSAITGYRVMRGTTAASLRQVAEVSGRSNTFYTDFDVLPVSQYRYAVRALSAQGSSPLSETVSATTQPVTTVSRYIRFDKDNRLVTRQDTDTPTPVVMVSNEGRPDAFKYASDNTTSRLGKNVSVTSGGAKNHYASSFRTGPQPGGYNLSSVRVSITNVSSDDSDSNQREAKARVSILADNGGLPGTVVHTLNEVTLAADATITASFTAEANATLQPNTTYWAMFEVTSSNSVLSGLELIGFKLPLTRHSLEDPCTVPGWSIGDDRVYASVGLLITRFVLGADGTTAQDPASIKFAILGWPVDGSVSENRCHDLPQADTTTGELPIGGGAIASLYPNPTDRNWFEVTLEADVLYQFDVFHSQRVPGREGTTTGNARVHRILDSTGTAVTSGVSYLEHRISGNPGDRVFFTPTAAGAYYLELGAGASPSLLSDRLDQLVNWGTCTGHLPDPTRQVQGDHYTLGSGDHTYRHDTWRHPNYDGWWEQIEGGTPRSRIFSCHRRFTHDIRGGGIYYVRANVADEYTAGTDTAGTIAPGGTLQGYLYQNNGSNIDVDWVKISLSAGTTYRFTYQLNSSGQTGPDITGLYDSGGTMVHGPVSGTYQTLFKRVTLEYTPTTAGNYYIGLGKTGASRDAKWQLWFSN